MKIVIDTNVVISGTFFGGYPRKVIEAVADGTLNACATPEIVDEYEEIVEEMVDRKAYTSTTIITPIGTQHMPGYATTYKTKTGL